MIQQQLRKLILPLLVPALLLHTVFFAFPVLNAFYYSLTSWSGISLEKDFNGLANFVRAFNDPTFIIGMENVFLFGGLGFLLIFPLSLLFSVMLSRKPPFERFLKFVIFAPTLLSVVVTAVLWGSIYNPVIGLLNETLRGLGLEELTLGHISPGQSYHHFRQVEANEFAAMIHKIFSRRYARATTNIQDFVTLLDQFSQPFELRRIIIQVAIVIVRLRHQVILFCEIFI